MLRGDSLETRNWVQLKWVTLFSFLALIAVVDSIHDFVGHLEAGQPRAVQWELYLDLVYWGPYVLLLPAAAILADRIGLTFRRPWSILTLALAGVAFTYIHALIASIPQTTPPSSYQTRFWRHLVYDFALDYAFFWVVVLLSHFWRHYAEIKQKELKNSQLEASLAQARLRAVEGQLNPHFFFNTLQSVSVLALSGERDRVVECLATLSDLLRVSFDRHRPQMTSLAQELEFIDGYLALQRLCLGPRLTVQRHVADETLNAGVPSLILQPLIENAIVHGVAAKPGRGTIRITTRMTSNRIAIEVADSGPGFQSESTQCFGVGLSATVERLRLLFGADHYFNWGRGALGGATVEIGFPLVPASSPQHSVLVERSRAMA